VALDLAHRAAVTRGMTDRPASVLIVCHANTARSVMAQVMLERMLAARNGSVAVTVRSGGIGPYARDGMLASLDARLVLREIGIQLAEDTVTSTDLRQHRERVAHADVILTMTEAQRTALAAFAEASGRPILTLRELGGHHGDIADPAAQGEEAFRAARDDIGGCLERGLDRLLALLSDARGTSPADGAA
jgi:protein-tyrosine-phosphatase